MKRIIGTFILPVALAALTSCVSTSPAFVRVENGHFVNTDEYFAGANLWYGAILASECESGDRQRLVRELDTLKSIGVTNLRVLVGGDGPDGLPCHIFPTLQKEPGVYNEKIFEGLDYLLSEMGKRQMKAVLYLNNSWEWSGGYGMYLEWAGCGKALIPAEAGYLPYTEEMSKFSTCEKSKELFYNHIRTVVSRTNTVTGKPYSEDPAIFAWQICNEPRCFSADPEVRHAFAGWLKTSAALIKSIDPNHMVSTGSEGYYGCEADYGLFEEIHSCPDIDYLTVHIWPYNWSWVTKDRLYDGLPDVISATDEYLDGHLAIAEKYRKPVVIEEFGYPRDGGSFEKTSSVSARDEYYRHILGRLKTSADEGGLLAGINFWAWGGLAAQSPDHTDWREGDDYCGDPAQEPQGLYSVYASDTSTIELIKSVAETIAK